MKKVIYENLLKENINKNLFDVDFEFDGLSVIEKQLLKDYINKITDDMMVFELVSVDKIVQPLDILIKLKNNKIPGEVKIKMHDKDENVIGIVIFKTLKMTDIKNLIDFDFNNKTGNEITVNFSYDDILYSNDGKEFEKLT